MQGRAQTHRCFLPILAKGFIQPFSQKQQYDRACSSGRGAIKLIVFVLLQTSHNLYFKRPFYANAATKDSDFYFLFSNMGFFNPWD